MWGASDMTLQFYLLPYLEAFHDAFPQIKVTVTNAPTPETLKHLQDGKIDFGIISTPVNNKYDFKMTPVRKIQDVFVAGKKKFEYLKGGKLSYKELENLPVMCLEGSTSTRKYVEDYLAERGTFVRPEFELATSDMLIQFAVRNLGVASVVSDFAEKYIESGELFVLKFDRAIPEREFCIVSNERAPMSAAERKNYTIFCLFRSEKMSEKKFIKSSSILMEYQWDCGQEYDKFICKIRIFRRKT